MKKYIFIFCFFLLAISVYAYAAAPTPWCYFTADNVCTNVTASTPLPVYMP